MSTIAPIVHPDSILVYLRSVNVYAIYDGTDELGIEARSGGRGQNVLHCALLLDAIRGL